MGNKSMKSGFSKHAGKKGSKSGNKTFMELEKDRAALKDLQGKLQEGGQEKHYDLVRKYVTEGNVGGALLILKHKRCREVLLERTTEQLTKIDEAFTSIDPAPLEGSTLESLQTGNSSLTKQLKEITPVDDIVRILEEYKMAENQRSKVGKMISAHLSPDDFSRVETELQNIMTLENDLNAPVKNSGSQPGKEDAPVSLADISLALPDVPTTPLSDQVGGPNVVGEDISVQNVSTGSPDPHKNSRLGATFITPTVEDTGPMEAALSKSVEPAQSNTSADVNASQSQLDEPEDFIVLQT